MSLDYNFLKMLVDSFLVEREVLTPDGYGGFTKTLSTVGTFIGRLDDEVFDEALFNGKDITFIRQRLFLEPNTAVQNGDIVTGKGRKFKVVFLRTEYENHPLEVICEEIDP